MNNACLPLLNEFVRVLSNYPFCWMPCHTFHTKTVFRPCESSDESQDDSSYWMPFYNGRIWVIEITKFILVTRIAFWTITKRIYVFFYFRQLIIVHLLEWTLPGVRSLQLMKTEEMKANPNKSGRGGDRDLNWKHLSQWAPRYWIHFQSLLDSFSKLQ